MTRYDFEVSARSRAPVATVFDLVGDARRWPEWTWVRRATITREGDPPPNGNGSVRRLGMAPFASSEEIVAWDPPSHLAYTMLRGMPVRRYRADVRFDPAPAGGPAGTAGRVGRAGPGGTARTEPGTVLTWSISFEPLVPGTGRPMRGLLRGIVGSFARGVTRYADHLVGST